MDGQVDTFDASSLDGWTMGMVVNITGHADGGPLGAGDGYIEAWSTDGVGAGSRLTIQSSQARWTGDWLAAGIDEIDVDILNDSGASLAIRLEIESGMNSAYTASASVPSDGMWATYTFYVDAASLVSGSDPVGLLSSVSGLRIEHNPNGTNPPPTIGAAMSLDNVGAFDTIPTCGDGMLETPEVCDGADLAGEDCAGQGFDGGTLGCAADCTALDTSTCTACGDGACDTGETEANCPEDCTPPAVCGDGVVDPGEVCDGADHGGETCLSQGFDGGNLICAADCTGFYTTGCTVDDGDDGGCETTHSSGGTTLLLVLGLLFVALRRRRK